MKLDANTSKEKLKFHVSEEKPLYEGFFKVCEYLITHDRFDGEKITGIKREVFCRGPAVGTLLIDPNRREVVLIEQFRVGVAVTQQETPWLLELVAGIVEPGESPAEVAIRESQEEAGCEPSEVELIQEYWVSPGGSDEKFYLYYGLIDSSRVSKFGGLPAENEDIKVHVYSFEEAFYLLRSGMIRNAMTIIGLQWLMLNESQFVE